MNRAKPKINTGKSETDPPIICMFIFCLHLYLYYTKMRHPNAFPEQMLRFIRISLYGITAACTVLFCLVHGHKQLEVISLLAGALSAFVAFTLSFSSAPKKNKKPATGCPLQPDNVEQALNILRGHSDGRHHYENLPKKARRKSIFGGRMMD